MYKLKLKNSLKQSSPYGGWGEYPLAYNENYSKSSCLLECMTNHTVNVCGFKYVYMPGPAKICSFTEYGT